MKNILMFFVFVFFNLQVSYALMFQSCQARSFQKKFYSTLRKVTNPKLKCVKTTYGALV